VSRRQPWLGGKFVVVGGFCHPTHVLFVGGGFVVVR